MRGRPVRRLTVVSALATILVAGVAPAALACGGLVAPNGTINLLRTTTLAAYHEGVEHYLTSFAYTGAAQGEIGSITPLPGVPTDVIKGGDWTLQRLVLETQPPLRDGFGEFTVAAAALDAEVILETQVDALDITVLKGGAVAVGNWAREHGFFLPPDAPEVLDFYARRSPIFMATRFNAERAASQGLVEGQGTPVHVVIPTPNPWVPLRILALGRQPGDLIQADIFLMTDREPVMLPRAVEPNGSLEQRGFILERSEPASASLMRDLRSDSRSSWIPEGRPWLTYLRLNVPASTLTFDLAIDASGFGQPDPAAAGLSPDEPATADRAWGVVRALLWVTGAFVVMAAIARRRRPTPPARFA